MEYPYSQGRGEAFRALEQRIITADELIVDGEQMVEKHVREENFEQAEFWIGMQAQARSFLLGYLDRAQRIEKCPYEITVLVLKPEVCTGENERITFWSEREKTLEILKTLEPKMKGRFISLTTQPVFFEEIGTLFLMRSPLDKDGEIDE